MSELAEADKHSADLEDEEAWARRELGARLMKLREERGWSRCELAARLGVSPSRLGNWERGENSPPLKRLGDLKRVLRVSLDELITGITAGITAGVTPGITAGVTTGAAAEVTPGKGPQGGEGKAEALFHLAALGSLLERMN